MQTVINTQKRIASLVTRYFLTLPRWVTQLVLIVHVIVISLLAYGISMLCVNITGVILYHSNVIWTEAVIFSAMAGFIYFTCLLLWLFTRKTLRSAWYSAVMLLTLSWLISWFAV